MTDHLKLEHCVSIGCKNEIIMDGLCLLHYQFTSHPCNCDTFWKRAEKYLEQVGIAHKKDKHTANKWVYHYFNFVKDNMKSADLDDESIEMMKGNLIETRKFLKRKNYAMPEIFDWDYYAKALFPNDKEIMKLVKKDESTKRISKKMIKSVVLEI